MTFRQALAWVPSSTSHACTILCLASTLVYLNTLRSGFTFDDNFAVISNGDVSDVNKPLKALFVDDFWGQSIRSEQSHKSYRPLTVLSFRLQRIAGQLLPEGLSRLKAGGNNNTRGVNPLPFHVGNILLHTTATCLVFWLARRLSAVRDLTRPCSGLRPNELKRPNQMAAIVRVVPNSLRQRSSAMRAAELKNDKADTPDQVDVRKNKDPQMAEALLAGLLFAVHPIHTEAVAGIVGQAELLCAALSILAFMAYMAAVDSRAEEGRIQRGRDWAHWPLMAAAVGLTWLAALAKEIGITIVAAMVMYDALLSPVALQAQPARCMAAAHSGRRHWPASWLRRLWVLLSQRMLLRAAVMSAAVLLYVRGRSLLAGDHLVRIFRKVENPIPFANSALTRTLSTGYLHAKYASLLVAPVQLSADWSFECVPLVEGLSDPRNLITAATYTWLLWTLCSIRPWQTVVELWQQLTGMPEPGTPTSHPQAGSQVEVSTHAQQRHMQRFLRWQCLVSFGLLVAPFFPASNVLFYVGTFIGERLLYFPSVGFCLLVAGLTSRAAQGLPQQQMHAGSMSYRRIPEALPVLTVLLACAAWTVTRNFDWVDEEQLFVAAQKVCWNSAKVQLNSGILQRRYQRWDAAIRHFEHARSIEPGYCEPGYWIGLCLINKSEVRRGVQELEQALSCKYVASEAATALVAVQREMQKAAAPGDPEPRRALARVLLHPSLGQVEEACDLLQQAALSLRLAPPTARTLPSPAEVMVPCDHHLRAAPANGYLAQARSCIMARTKLLSSLQMHRPTSISGKKAAYKYVVHSQRHDCRRLHTSRGPSEAHALAINLVQAADAEDAWLQAEWGQSLLAEGDRRMQEAVTHLHVAGILFAKQAYIPLDNSATAPMAPFRAQLGIDVHAWKVQLLTQEQVLQAAIWSFELAVKFSPSQPCSLIQSACTLRSKHIELLQNLGSKQQALLDHHHQQFRLCLVQLKMYSC